MTLVIGRNDEIAEPIVVGDRLVTFLRVVSPRVTRNREEPPCPSTNSTICPCRSWCIFVHRAGA